MDYEKKYKQSLALMGDCIPDEDGYVHVRPQDIFPELRELDDEGIRKVIYGLISIQPSQFFDNGFSKYEMLAWLEKQGEQKPTDEDMKEALRTEYEKGRADAIAQMQQEWSEEDERAIGIIKTALEHPYDMEGKWDRKFALGWLKSLKERYTWKPSEEQMRALHDLNLTGNISYAGQGQVLINLYNDLKKLKVE